MQATYYPRARRTGLDIHTLPDETVVFDTDNDRANCLNATSAWVWNHADGTRSITDLTREMSAAFDTPVSTQLVWYALEQLSDKKLLQERPPARIEPDQMNRRAFLAQAGLVGAAIAIPVIVSIVAPAPAHASSSCFGLDC